MRTYSTSPNDGEILFNSHHQHFINSPLAHSNEKINSQLFHVSTASVTSLLTRLSLIPEERRTIAFTAPEIRPLEHDIHTLQPRIFTHDEETFRGDTQLKERS
ncbi:hypothetical protein E2C01_095003 [Portunus trituberculatus]|uniref:Uncharacterized protein n=1 Tax=Portunus trituberculatus TaxID=210409 RepID=A0A5B7JS00_PORTR|nr:hypothetical protein [Portunus trituberculatus]